MQYVHAPGSCPWDREQTFDAIKPYLSEETYQVADAARDPDKKLTAVEDELYRIKNQSSQDLNFPIKLNNRLAALLGVVQSSDAGPNKQSNVVYEGLANGGRSTRRAGPYRRSHGDTPQGVLQWTLTAKLLKKL